MVVSGRMAWGCTSFSGSRLASALMLLALSIVAASGAIAQTVLQVNSAADKVDVNLADAKCETDDGTCTLRAAIMQANRLPILGAVIMVPAGTYQLGTPVGADGEDTGDLNLLDPPGIQPGPTTIIGAGSALTIIDGNRTDRVFNISTGRNISMSGVSVINGLFPGNGGGIYIPAGKLTLNDCVVANNESSYEGGGIYNAGTLSLVHSIFSTNHSGNGGGVFNDGSLTATEVTFTANVGYQGGGALLNYINGSSELDRSSVVGNTSTYGDGGGAENLGTLILNGTTISENAADTGAGIKNLNGKLYVVNSTISGNAASSDGGGIYNNALGQAKVYNSTIAFNEADRYYNDAGDGAGVYNLAGATFIIENAILAGNYLPGQYIYHDCIGILVIYGSNRVSGVPGCSADPGSPGYVGYIGSIYELGTLTDNGGPTRTIAILPPSDMIAGGIQCVDQYLHRLTTDQRGRARPPGSACDIGAFEYNELFRGGFE